MCCSAISRRKARLPVSFPQASGQEPYYYDHRPTGRPQVDAVAAFKARYSDVSNEPLFAFGHGLTYSTVDYGVPFVSSPRAGARRRRENLCEARQFRPPRRA